jgi:hypothetical protein
LDSTKGIETKDKVREMRFGSASFADDSSLFNDNIPFSFLSEFSMRFELWFLVQYNPPSRQETAGRSFVFDRTQS